MNFFKRSKRIIKANSLSKLEKMENPLKMIRLSIQELKEGINDLDNDIKNLEKNLSISKQEKEDYLSKVSSWNSRAKLALEKNKEDLAKEAIREKLKFQKRSVSVDDEIKQIENIISSIKEKNDLLKSRLIELIEKEKYLNKREEAVKQREKVEQLLKTSQMEKFDQRYEHVQRLIDRKEAELNTISKFDDDTSTESKFQKMENEDKIDNELKKLKEELNEKR